MVRIFQRDNKIYKNMSAGKVNNMGRKSARLAAKKIIFNSIPKASKAPIGGHPKK